MIHVISVIRPRPIVLSSLAMAAMLAYVCGACSNGDVSRQCNVGADCASGACNADGTCVAPGTTDGGKDGATAEGGSGGTDSGTVKDGSYDFDAGPGCIPNKDGTITHDEVPLGPGLKAPFKVSGAATIDTAGTKNADGTYTWDFTGAYAGDQDAFVQTLSPVGTYWEKDFPKASYASKIAQSATLLGVFEYGTGALSLLGVVSPSKVGGVNTSDTELTYDTPIPILKFPFMKDSAWKTTSNAGGTYNGNTIAAAYYTETYDTVVDKVGTVKTPFADFPALRISTLLTQDVNFITFHTITITRTYAWVTECYGTIAKASSKSASSSAGAPTAPIVDFTDASELIRLTK
jgi:hypothetical protein